MWNQRGKDMQFFRNHYVPLKTQRSLHGSAHRFQAGDAANKTSCAPVDPSGSTRPSFSSKHHKYMMHGDEIARIQSKEEYLTTKLSVPT